MSLLASLECFNVVVVRLGAVCLSPSQWEVLPLLALSYPTLPYPSSLTRFNWSSCWF